MPNIQAVLDRISAYARQATYVDHNEIAVMEHVRRIYRWIFDLIKNILVVVALKVISEKSHSNSIAWLAYVLEICIFGYIFTYTQGLYLYPFSARKRSWLVIIDALIFGLIVLISTVLVNVMTSRVVDELSKAQEVPSQKSPR